MFTATVEEFPCPVGTVRTDVGAGAVTDCAPCDAGSYCLEGSSTPNGVCKEGFYCPTNFTNPYGNEPPYIGSYGNEHVSSFTVKILKIGTPEIITIIVLQLEQLDFTVQYCVQKNQTE